MAAVEFILYTAAVTSSDRRARGLLLAVVVVGLAIRAFFATGPSHTDVKAFRRWATFTVDHRFTDLWSQAKCDYMPAFPAALSVLARAHQAASASDGQPIPDWVIKIPAIAGDVATALLLFLLGKRLAGEWNAAIVASVHFLNPGLIVDSAVWGQVDVLHSLFVLLAFVFAHLGRTRNDAWHHAAWASLVVGVLFKLQAVVFAPLLVVPSVLGRRPRAIAVSAAVAVAVASFAFVPLLIAGQGGTFWREVIESAPTRYSRVTMAAFNLWWIVASPIRREVHDTDPFVAGISYKAIGLALFALAYAWALIRLWRGGRGTDPRSLLLCAGFVAVAFFVLPTEMHDRYLYPAIPLLAMASLFPRSRAFYALFSLTLAANLLAPILRRAVPALDDAGALSPWTTVVASLNLIGLVWLAIALFRLGRIVRETEIEK